MEKKVNWVHDASDPEVRAVPTPAATNAVYRQIEQWLPMTDQETDNVLALTTRTPSAHTCRAFFSSRVEEPMRRQQSKLLEPQPSIAWSCMADPHVHCRGAGKSFVFEETVRMRQQESSDEHHPPPRPGAHPKKCPVQ